MKYRKKPVDSEVVSPPGEILRDMLDERGMTVLEFIMKGSKSLSNVKFNFRYTYTYAVLAGKEEINPFFAEILHVVFGTPASFWLEREKNYRDWLKKQENKV